MLDDTANPGPRRGINAKEAETLLKGYLDDFNNCVEAALSAWADVPAALKKDLSKRARACFLNDKMRAAARVVFNGKPEVVIEEKHGTTYFHFGTALILRFKKATRYGETKNIPTRAQRRFWANLHFEDWDLGTHASVGYVIDEFGRLLDVVVACANGDKIAWRFSILTPPDMGSQPVRLPVAPPDNTPLAAATPEAKEKRRRRHRKDTGA